MNILPIVGFGFLFLYVAKGHKVERRKALREAETVYQYGELPDIIGDLKVGEKFTIELPAIEESWLLKATPPNDEVILVEKTIGDPTRFVFKAKKKGSGSIIIHRAITTDTQPLEIVEFNVEVE